MSELERREDSMHRLDTQHSTVIILMVLLLLALGAGIGILGMFMVLL